ncbi:hypothetical protein MMC09_004857 [Bachmanniomyces sp. S44760]|nr:hypothetical protein [Bachmanniomyces sp. S44760]
MCFVSSDDSALPPARPARAVHPAGPVYPRKYAINRTEHDPFGYHERSRTSVEKHLNAAPPAVARGPNRYPKKHRNKEQHYNTPDQLWEYPTMPYPYAQQNAKGKARKVSPSGRVYNVSPGYTRTIVDNNKKIHGVSYHPHNNPHDFVRAGQIY